MLFAFLVLYQIYVFLFCCINLTLGIVLKKHLHSLSVKPVCETRWENQIESVKLVRYQIGEISNTLCEAAKTSDVAQFKSEAEGLANRLSDFKFLMCLCFWLNILYFHMNFVSKEL